MLPFASGGAVGRCPFITSQDVARKQSQLCKQILHLTKEQCDGNVGVIKVIYTQKQC